MLESPHAGPLFATDLLVRARATHELAVRLYGSPSTVSFTQRRDAYPRLVSELPAEVRGFIERSHAGYYGSANPIIFAVGWTRGGVGVSQPPPSERWDIGCPSYGCQHDHISTFQKLGAGLARALRDSSNPELAPLDDAALGNFGSAGVLFTNITPECASATEAKHRADWRPFLAMFAEAVRVFRPLAIVAAGNDSRRFFLHKAYPDVKRLDAVQWNPKKADGTAGESYRRHQGVIELEGAPTGYLELPFHPSFGGRHAPFHAQALEAMAKLGLLVQSRRKTAGERAASRS